MLSAQGHGCKINEKNPISCNLSFLAAQPATDFFTASGNVKKHLRFNSRPRKAGTCFINFRIKKF
jgi:hypothetical protein